MAKWWCSPLAWSEVKQELDPAEFNLENFLKRARRADPWRDFFRSRESLKGAARLVAKL